jgi:hypothetical protein
MGHMCVSLYILAYQKKFFQKPTTYIKNQQKTCLIWIRCRRQHNVNKQLLITHHKKKFRENSPSTIIQDANQIFMCTIFPISVDQDLLFYEYTPSSSNPFSNFFSRFAKNKKKEIQNESYRGHCLQRKKKGSSDITKKKQNRLFAKKKKYPP